MLVAEALSPRNAFKRRSGTSWENVDRDKIDILHKTKDQTNNVTGESLDKTREIIGLVHECQDAGVNTLYMLYSQGEQLKRTDKLLDETGHGITQASVKVENIKKKERAPLFCLPFVSCCIRDPPKRVQKQNDRRLSRKSVPREPVDVYRNRLAAESKILRDKYETSNINLQMPTINIEKYDRNSKEGKLEENLGNISRHVSNLKIIASDMGTETSRQNERLDVMNVKAQESTLNLEGVSRNVNSINNQERTNVDEKMSTKHFHCCFF